MIDTHAHLMSCKRPIEEILETAQSCGLSVIINVGMDIKSSMDALALAQQHAMIFPTAGIHPCNREEFDRFKDLEILIKSNRFVAIGETGLDYYWDTSYNNEQHRIFRSHLELARTTKLPVIIHNRNADEDIVRILADFPDVKKVVHCFSGTADLAGTLLQDNNTLLSFTGSITFSKKGKTIQALQNIPLDKIMIETDSPFITPPQYKPNENQPAYVGAVAKRIAEVKALPIDTIIETTTQNAIEFFNLTAF